MAMYAKVRRRRLRDACRSATSRATSLSRNTIKEWLRHRSALPGSPQASSPSQSSPSRDGQFSVSGNS
jgi:hypothetical protein